METTFQGPSVRTTTILVVAYDRCFVFQGRIAGQDGKTKFTIENASRTRIVLADT
jgi:hypothetical protein